MKTFNLKNLKISKLDNNSIDSLIEYLLSLDKSEVSNFLLKVADEFDSIDPGDSNEEKILIFLSNNSFKEHRDFILKHYFKEKINK